MEPSEEALQVAIKDMDILGFGIITLEEFLKHIGA